MQKEPTAHSNSTRRPSSFQTGTRLVAEATAGASMDAQVSRAVYGESYAEFGAFVTKELIAEQWANPDRFVVKLGELRSNPKQASGEQK